MMWFVGVALGQPFLWTGRTPVGELSVGETRVRLVQETLDLKVLSADELQVRADYVLDNPGEKVVLRFAVPVTSGGTGEVRSSPAAASIRLTDASGEFVPCLVRPTSPRALPVELVSGAHRITSACTADVVVPAGVSNLRLSYEGELLHEAVATPPGIPVGDRHLVYDFTGAATWHGSPDLLVAVVDLGPFAASTPDLPPGARRDGAIISWTVEEPDHAALDSLVLPLGGADTDAVRTIARAHVVEGLTGPSVLRDADPSTTWCGRSARLKVPEPLGCGAQVWSAPALDVDVVDCATGESLVASVHRQPGARAATLHAGGDCFELRPAEGGCLAEVALRPATCPVTEASDHGPDQAAAP
jgi:hypothetical protein